MAEGADAVGAPPPGAAEGAARDADLLRGWIGARVDAIGGDGVGKVDGFLVDARDGTPTWLVVRLGRFGRRTALPVELVAAGATRIWASLGRDVIRSAPEVRSAAELSVEAERDLARHFGIPPESGRLARIADRAADELGSIPSPS